MIPVLYDKTGVNKIGDLIDSIECYVEEERNGIFELTMVYPANTALLDNLCYENIIVVDANDYLKNQKFRIYNTRKLMSNRIEICARHISFDLAHDWIDALSINNQSCEYALNMIFKKSQFSSHFKGHSDIINAQDYAISETTCLNAIGGSQGSILDTFGTGAEILRDNTDIHVLNRRGSDNDVSIEYRKNLTGLEVEEDTTDLVTRILPYATYTDDDSNEIKVKGSFVDSSLINNYAHPYVKYIDYSEKFDEDNLPTASKLESLAKKEYINNKVDIPKMNYKIEFIPLSKCAGYEGLEDKINLCDTVTIRDTRYGIDTQSKVIKVTYDALRDRYDSMELGEPRTTLGDIIGGTGESTQGPPGPQGPQGPAGADGSIGDFPSTLPETPTITTKVYGFANVEVSWTFENKVYYSYELYASKTKGFVPNTFNLIFEGQASTFLHQVNPNETWYYQACAINSHGSRTEFSDEVEVSTVKITDLSNYVESAAIGDALIGELNLGRGWVGQLRGNWIDAKQLSVTDGNGKRTLDIDSFGNVQADITSLKIQGSNVSELYTTKTEFNQTTDQLELKTVSLQRNLVNNSNGYDGVAWWGVSNAKLEVRTCLTNSTIKKGFHLVNSSAMGIRVSQEIAFDAGIEYTIQVSCTDIQGSATNGFKITLQDSNGLVVFSTPDLKQKGVYRFTVTLGATAYYKFGIWHNGATQTHGSVIALEDLIIVKGRYLYDLTWVDSTDDKASINIKANQIVNKVSQDEFSSLLEQNAKSVEVAFNSITDNVQNSEGKFVIRNGAIELYNLDGQNVFNIGGDGWINVWGLKVFGANNPIVFTGSGDKGIEINAEESNIAYIDFSRGGVNDYTTRIAQLPNNGTLLSIIGGLEIIPDTRQSSDARLELRSPIAGPAYIDFAHDAEEDFQKRILSYNNDPQLHILGGLTIDGPRLLVDRIGRNTTPSSSSIYFENNADFQGKTIYNAVIPMTADYAYPVDFAFTNTETTSTTGDIIDSIMFNEAIGADNIKRLTMDLTNVLDTDYTVMNLNGEAYGDSENLLKLALKEIKDLRVRIKNLEGNVS